MLVQAGDLIVRLEFGVAGGKVGSKGSTWWRSPCRKTVTLHGLPGTPTPTLCSTYDAQLEQLSCSQVCTPCS